ncbi:probable proteasome subunit beta type-2 [Scaptodrosophila lebanonensis]|uniref:Proteasome subunit beta n=1 Tax=Drosophila lebanonensis TaxID=7225 RepID=A0A6J2TUG9_DROLE|nr:probable proteasome subunit beta type-2 [Scaptodrosophila lebanonensis]
METMLGIRGYECAMMACDTMQAKTLMVIRKNQSKFFPLSKYSVMAVTGDAGDSRQLTRLVSRDVNLYQIKNGYSKNPRSVAHSTRNTFMEYARAHNRYLVTTMLAGYDEKDGPDLHIIDSLGSAYRFKHAGHGYGSVFTSTILAENWHNKLTESEAYDILKRCVSEIQKRSLVELENFEVYVVDKDGVRQLETIDPKLLKMDSIVNLPH